MSKIGAAPGIGVDVGYSSLESAKGGVVSSTTFAKWRDDLGLSIGEAASELGLSVAQVSILVRGRDAKGRPALPRADTLKLMQAVRLGIKLVPFELRPDEVEAQRELRRKAKASMKAKAVGRAAMRKAA